MSEWLNIEQQSKKKHNFRMIGSQSSTKLPIKVTIDGFRPSDGFLLHIAKAFKSSQELQRHSAMLCLKCYVIFMRYHRVTGIFSSWLKTAILLSHSHRRHI